MNTVKKVVAPAGEENCPADALMNNFRKHLNEGPGEYAKNIEVSESSIKFWKDHADYVTRSGGSYVFQWDEIPEENLPPLKIKIVKRGDSWYLSYLKEYGDETTLIQGKSRKGKNAEGAIFLDKIEEGPKPRRKF